MFSQISIVRHWMPIALSAWLDGSGRFSISRQRTPRRASSMARVSPAGPAPTTSTSVSNRAADPLLSLAIDVMGGRSGTLTSRVARGSGMATALLAPSGGGRRLHLRQQILRAGDDFECGAFKAFQQVRKQRRGLFHVRRIVGPGVEGGFVFPLGEQVVVLGAGFAQQLLAGVPGCAAHPFGDLAVGAFVGLLLAVGDGHLDHHPDPGRLGVDDVQHLERAAVGRLAQVAQRGGEPVPGGAAAEQVQRPLIGPLAGDDEGPRVCAVSRLSSWRRLPGTRLISAAASRQALSNCGLAPFPYPHPQDRAHRLVVVARSPLPLSITLEHHAAVEPALSRGR